MRPSLGAAFLLQMFPNGRSCRKKPISQQTVRCFHISKCPGRTALTAVHLWAFQFSPMRSVQWRTQTSSIHACFGNLKARSLRSLQMKRLLNTRTERSAHRSSANVLCEDLTKKTYTRSFPRIYESSHFSTALMQFCVMWNTFRGLLTALFQNRPTRRRQRPR